jgi:carbonic anhydrase
VTPQNALERLLEGNTRYVAEQAAHPHQNAERRAAVVARQEPFAAVFGCVDSRVPPEIVFDQGVGDLFVIRTAGAVTDDAVLASLEYGVAVLEVPLLLVLGHEGCGAVRASLEAIEDGKTLPSHLGFLVDGLQPAIRATQGDSGDAADNAVREQARRVAALLRSDPIIGAAVEAGTTEVVAAHYALGTGRVSLL